jgi:hypothetical protein
MSNELKTPNTYVYTLDELQKLVLDDVLQRAGINPKASTVRHFSGFRLDANVMTLTVLSCDPVVPAKSEPETPIDLVQK